MPILQMRIRLRAEGCALITQLVSDRAGTEAQVCLVPKLAKAPLTAPRRPGTERLPACPWQSEQASSERALGWRRAYRIKAGGAVLGLLERVGLGQRRCSPRTRLPGGPACLLRGSSPR